MPKEIIVETGALVYVNEIIERRSMNALRSLEALKMRSQGEIFLRDLVYYCGHRNH